MKATWTVILTRAEPGNSRRVGPFDKIERPMPRHPYRARGRVFKRGNTWRYEVLVGGKVVSADNTSHWRTIFDGCNEAVWAFDRALWTGHKIAKTWDELVDGAK